MNKTRKIIDTFIQALFWIGFGAAFWGAFEMAYQAAEYGPQTEHPIFSGTFGGIVPHHYIVGFILIGVAWFAYFFFKLRRKRKALGRVDLSRCYECGKHATWNDSYERFECDCGAMWTLEGIGSIE